MTEMNKINAEALENVIGGAAKTVNTNTKQNAAVRSGPGTNFEQIASLPNNTTVNFTGKIVFSEKDGRNFAEISSPVRGFIAASIIGLDR